MYNGVFYKIDSGTVIDATYVVLGVTTYRETLEQYFFTNSSTKYAYFLYTYWYFKDEEILDSYITLLWQNFTITDKNLQNGVCMSIFKRKIVNLGIEITDQIDKERVKKYNKKQELLNNIHIYSRKEMKDFFKKEVKSKDKYFQLCLSRDIEKFLECCLPYLFVKGKSTLKKKIVNQEGGTPLILSLYEIMSEIDVRGKSATEIFEEVLKKKLEGYIDGKYVL